MTVENAILSRIDTLIEEASRLSVGTQYDQVRSEAHRQECAAWLTSALNSVCLVCPDPTSPYRASVQRTLSGGILLTANKQVGEVSAILKRLLVDVNAGLLASVTDRARAEVFDDFLDHGELYWKSGKKSESGVIVGVVFEDSMRRVCRKRGVVEKGEQLDQLISTLTAVGVLTATKAKRARVAAHVRTKATHAQWDEFDLDDVRASIDFAREFIASELEA